MKRTRRRPTLVAPWETVHAVLVARESPERDVAPPGTDLLANDDPKDMPTLSVKQL